MPQEQSYLEFEAEVWSARGKRRGKIRARRSKIILTKM